jgi:hypothetical protein
MNTDLLKLIGTVVGVIVSGPLVFALVRAAMFIGGAMKVQEAIAGTMREMQRTLENHGSRITVIETERETEWRLGEERRQRRRRESDRGGDFPNGGT